PAMNAYEVTQVYSFAQSAKKKFDRNGFTSLVLLEKDMHSGPEITTLLQPFDGVIEVERIRTGDRIFRKVGVLHLKDTAPDPTFRILEMTESGMRVVRETTKPSPASSVGPAEGAVLESQEERARRLSLIMQIASERLKMNPKDSDALFAMAAAQATLDDPRAALQSLDRLAELDPAYPGLWVLKTKLHARLGEADRARQSRLRADQVELLEAKGAVSTVPCPMCDAPVERAAWPHERSDERPRSNERTHEWRGPDERIDEWSWSHERSDQRARPDKRSDEWFGSDERNHKRTGTHERTCRRTCDGLPVREPPWNDANRGMEAVCDSAGRRPPASHALVLRTAVQRGPISDPNRRAVQ